jgi:hypothetical protein
MFITMIPFLLVTYLWLWWGWAALAVLPLVDLLLLCLHPLIALAAKWVLVGRYKEGQHPLYGAFYIRHWLAKLLSMVSGCLHAAFCALLPTEMNLPLLHWAGVW